MNNDIDIEQQNGPRKGKVLAGIVLLIVGASLLLKEFVFFPHWLISFPTGLIVLGLYMGGKNNFQNKGWLIVTALGCFLLIGRIVPDFDSSAFFWPLFLIGIGVYFIMRRNDPTRWDKKESKRKWDAGKYNFGKEDPYAAKEPIVDYTVSGDATADPSTPPNPDPIPNPGTGSTGGFTGDEHLDSVSIFGSVKKTIFSKNFQGGEVVNVFGGSELDLTQANINGRVYVEVTQIFGGTKIIVPSHWMVVSDMAAVFAGFDDKRVRMNAPLDNNKVLVLKGVSIFAGVDIRSY